MIDDSHGVPVETETTIAQQIGELLGMAVALAPEAGLSLQDLQDTLRRVNGVLVHTGDVDIDIGDAVQRTRDERDDWCTK